MVNVQRSELKERFLKIYANLPLSAREEIIYIIPTTKAPVTWNVAYLEVKNDTEFTQDILVKLNELGII